MLPLPPIFLGAPAACSHPEPPQSRRHLAEAPPVPPRRPPYGTGWALTGLSVGKFEPWHAQGSCNKSQSGGPTPGIARGRYYGSYRLPVPAPGSEGGWRDPVPPRSTGRCISISTQYQEPLTSEKWIHAPKVGLNYMGTLNSPQTYLCSLCFSHPRLPTLSRKSTFLL